MVEATLVNPGTPKHLNRGVREPVNTKAPIQTKAPGYLLDCLKQVRAERVRPMRFGKVKSVVGLLVEATQLGAAVGELCYIHESEQPGGRTVKAEVVGVRENTAILMPLDETVGLRAGCLVERSVLPLTIRVGEGLLGRVIDGNGRPLDKKGPLLHLSYEQPVHREPPSPLDRRMVDTPLPTSITLRGLRCRITPCNAWASTNPYPGPKCFSTASL